MNLVKGRKLLIVFLWTANVSKGVNYLKHIIFYSGGLGSWMTANRVIKQHGKENVILLFTDTKMEDEDLYRFLDDTEQDFDIPVTRIADGRDVWEVFKDSRFIGNSRVAQCSHVLKQAKSLEFIESGYKPHEPTFIKRIDKKKKEVIYFESEEERQQHITDWREDEREPCKLYLGIDWTEEHRKASPTFNWLPYVVEFPMCEAPYMNKVDVVKELENRGIELPRLYKKGFSHNNCFTGDTRFISSEGIFTLKEKLGQNIAVLGKGGRWKEATVEAFGRQQIYELKLKRYNQEKVIKTTVNHRWPVRVGRKSETMKLTSEVKNGDKIVSNFSSTRREYDFINIGVMHGFSYGDGSASANNENPCRLTLCGEKVEMKKWFANEKFVEKKGIGIETSRLPRTFKELPHINESKAFLYSWIAGYFAADGSVKNGELTISSSKKTDIEFVVQVCTKLGIAVNSIKTESRCGYNDFETNLYSINLVAFTLTEHFFLRKIHRDKFLETPKKNPAEWTVESVTRTENYEEVYCAVVPDGNQFTLENNQKTFNCGGFCVRAGQGHFINLLEQMPERYKYHEAKEEEMRQFLGRDDVSILKRTRKGVTERLTLKQLREEHESGSKQIDMFDIGGCGCFVDD